MAKHIEREYPYFLCKLPMPKCYVQLTADNCREYLIHGRIIYSLLFKKGEAWVNADGSLRPRWERKGWYFTVGEPPFRTKNAYEVDREESLDEYKEYGQRLMKRINEGTQWVNTEEKLVETLWANRNTKVQTQHLASLRKKKVYYSQKP